MFDLIATGNRANRRRGLVPLLTSWAIHAMVIGAVVVVPLFYAAEQLPDTPREVLAFVTPVPPAPPHPSPSRSNRSSPLMWRSMTKVFSGAWRVAYLVESSAALSADCRKHRRLHPRSRVRRFARAER
jgi:hypothetical protein